MQIKDEKIKFFGYFHAQLNVCVLDIYNKIYYAELSYQLLVIEDLSPSAVVFHFMEKFNLGILIEIPSAETAGKAHI